jgi:hypothetical protein
MGADGGFRSDAWLSGFADGEGSFGLYPTYRSRGGYVPRFIVQLRADDIAVLEALREEFGGKVRVYSSQAERGEGKPKASWIVSSKADLQGLITYFDRFPLRAKKVRDYGIWRRAVLAYIAAGTHSPELPALHAALVEVRAYDDAALVPDYVPAGA